MVEICFATGNLHRFLGGIDAFKFIESLNVDGIEVTYGKTLQDRPLLESDFEVLKKQKVVSLHSPFRLVIDSTSEDDLLKKLKMLEVDYLKSKAHDVVIHPNEPLPRTLLPKTKIHFLTENLNPKKGSTTRPKLGFEKVLDENPEFGLCLDVSHAFDYGVGETERIVKKWKNRIEQIHFSNNRYHKDHLSFEKVSRDFLKSIEPIRELNVPIVVEEDMKICDKKWIDNELRRIRKILD